MIMNMNTVKAKMIPHMLSAEQTKLPKEISSDHFQRTENEQNLLQLGNYL